MILALLEKIRAFCKLKSKFSVDFIGCACWTPPWQRVFVEYRQNLTDFTQIFDSKGLFMCTHPPCWISLTYITYTVRFHWLNWVLAQGVAMDARFMQMHNLVLTREVIINSMFPVDRTRELNFHRETAVSVPLLRKWAKITRNSMWESEKLFVRETFSIVMTRKKKKKQNFFIYARKLQQWSRSKLLLLPQTPIKTVGGEITNKWEQISGTKIF